MQLKKLSVLLLFLLCSLKITSVQAQEDSAFAVVKKYIETLNQHNWSAIPDLWVKDRRTELVDMISNKENQEKKVGFFNVKSAKLRAWKELPYKYAERYLPIRYMEKFKNPRVLYVAVDYKVHRQDKFRINRVNYFLVVVVKQEGEWKIALTPIPPISSIVADGYGFGTDDEKTYDERRLQFVD